MNTRISTTGLIDEDARRRFESAWIRGCPQPLEDYLPAQDAPSYFATLEELVLVELEFAWKSWTEARTKGDSQQPKRIAHYRERFPALDRPEVLHHLLREELRVRLRWGDNPTAAEYGEEFGTVCEKPTLSSPDPALVLSRHGMNSPACPDMRFMACSVAAEWA